MRVILGLQLMWFFCFGAFTGHVAIKNIQQKQTIEMLVNMPLKAIMEVNVHDI